MAVSTYDVLSEIQYHLLEVPNGGASFSSEQWTRDEVIGYIRNRQNQFLKDTAAFMKRSTVAYTPGQLTQPLPTDWAITQRMVWKDTTDGTYKELPRSDAFSADYGQQNWSTVTATKPSFYTDEELPSLQFYAGPVPTNTGTPEVLYVYQIPLPFTFFNSTMRIDEFAPYPRLAGMPIQDRYRWTSVGLSLPTIPSLDVTQDFTPAIKWGVIADMLSKVGRGQDLTRAAYAESRYREGVEAVAIILAGWQGG